MKQRLDLSDKKGLQLWSDFHQIQAKESLKPRLYFPDKKVLELLSDLLMFDAEKSLKQRLVFPEKNGLIAIMVRFPSNSSQNSLKQR